VFVGNMVGIAEVGRAVGFTVGAVLGNVVGLGEYEGTVEGV